MYGSLIYISSLKHEDIINQFDSILNEEKYSCFPLPDIENIGTNLYLLGMPFNKKIHWFIAQETMNGGEIPTVNVIDKHVLDGTPKSKVITLSVRERGLLDNIAYSFSNDVNRDNSYLKMIISIRKNSMGDYDFYYSHDNVFKITPRKSHACFN
ncbi:MULTISPECIES: hypothetical protein [Bacillaceae]|uniref:Uncharacterized protein n=1 Tax=Psychrobacillus lasiicapitis TaxID=1636719 RepID=A0A544SQK6_9BACI|nr:MULTISPECIES: hypothetical protein [Bacillaceae]TQR07474.1 hypothetical protein FG382_22470 [Psychrobacillus lasiicapitis]GGA50223.1 hypothetical protein GCM10011384_44810 [Psychrobacillus lasiicapitis]